MKCNGEGLDDTHWIEIDCPWSVAFWCPIPWPGNDRERRAGRTAQGMAGQMGDASNGPVAGADGTAFQAHAAPGFDSGELPGAGERGQPVRVVCEWGAGGRR